MVTFPSPCLKYERTFLWYSVWDLDRSTRGKTHKIWFLPQDWSTLEFLIFRLVHTEPPAILSLRCSLPTWGVVLTEVSVHWFLLMLWFSVSAFFSLSNFGAGGLPSGLNSLTHLRRAVDFPVHLDFYLLWGSDDF